jgi:hypothetical protein
MKAFEDGQRVRYVGSEGLRSQWAGRVGVVKDTYRDYDGQRVLVQFDGEERSISFEVDDLEPVKQTYHIQNWAEGSASATLELTDAEAALIQRVIDALDEDPEDYAPSLTIDKE